MKLPKLPDTADQNQTPAKPKTLLESIFTATPVVLTVLATVLAGLSSGELTRSQYYRSMAAQLQAKASDQWSYFQAKKMRETEAQNTLDLLAASAHPGKLEASILTAVDQRLPNGTAELTGLSAQVKSLAAQAEKITPFCSVMGIWTAPADEPMDDSDVVTAMAAVRQKQTEVQMAPLLRQISADRIDRMMAVNDANVDAFDAAIAPAAEVLDDLHSTLSAVAEAVPSDAQINAAQADVAAARLRCLMARWDGEAKYNQNAGELYEVQVHQTGVISDRHRARSANFFYGMLAAQAGVVISTFSLAMKRRSTFWALAAVAGGAAAAFSGYVYLYT